MSESKLQICPKCGRAYTERPALSRVDNKTAICPTCGTMEALASIPHSNKFPKAAAQLVLAWMNEQMYGDVRTEWTSGNEHDRMRDAADFLESLCKGRMLKRVCRYSVFKADAQPGRGDCAVDSVQFTVFAPTSEELDAAMEARFDKAEKEAPEGEFIDDCGWGVDVPAEWDELTEEWI